MKCKLPFNLKFLHRSFFALLFFCMGSTVFAQPPNDLCANAETLPVQANSCSVQTMGTNVAATASGELPNPSCGSFGSGFDVWYKFTVPASGNVSVEMNSATGGPTDFVMQIYSGACGALALVECDDDDGPGAFPFVALTGQAPGQTLYARVFEYGNNAFGPFVICAWEPPPPPPPPANDLCTSAEVLQVQPNSCTTQTPGTNVSATASGELPNPTCSSFGAGMDNWYSFTVPASGEVSIEVSTAGGPTDWGMSVYSGACGALTQVECDDDDGPGFFPFIALTGQTPGTVLYARVFEYGNNATGPFNICAWDPNPICPAPTGISVDNVLDVSANVNFDAGGETINVEITAAGAGQGTGTITPGVTSPYTFTGLTPSTGYDVYVMKDCVNGVSSAWEGPFSFTTLDPCDPPTMVIISDVMDVTAVVNFNSGGNATNVELTAGGAAQGTGTVFSGVTSPYTFTGLTEKTSYSVYVQNDCGVLQSDWDGPFSFTTLVTPKISIVDSSGNGLPNISDPCDCNDPENIEDPATQVVNYFHDFVTVVSNPGETWQLVSYNSGQLFDNGLIPIPAGTALTEVSPGLYRLDGLHASNVGFNANFNRTTNPLAAPLVIGNTCNGVVCSFQAVPTMGQWGMILFAIIMLSFGVIFVMRQQVALAGMGNASASFSNGLPFDKTSFGKILAYVMIGLAATFAVAITVFGYEMTDADVPGSLLAGPALAYLIHLIVMSSKKEG
jgi:hypothetical protein